MWRMDSWLSLFLARQAAGSNAPELDSEFLLLRFEIDAHGAVTSPQIPPREDVFERLLPSLQLGAARAAVARADSLVDAKLGSPDRRDGDTSWLDFQAGKSKNEFDARVACAVPRPPGADSAGRQVVAWLDAPAPAEPVLAFVRRVETGGEERFSGFVFDWPRLRERLLFEIRDLFPAARLERASAV